MENKIKPSELDWTTGKVKGFCGKELIDIDKGSVKLVKISPFATYPDHVHPDKTEYAYVIAGCPEFEIDNKHYTSEQGDFFIFPTKVKHAIKNKTDAECILLIGAIIN
ncbi:MAG: cupin domain-containing protein [Bacteroidia bacterium]